MTAAICFSKYQHLKKHKKRKKRQKKYFVSLYLSIQRLKMDSHPLHVLPNVCSVLLLTAIYFWILKLK